MSGPDPDHRTLTQKITGDDLAALLLEEIEAEEWGDIDAWWFLPYNPKDYGYEPGEEPDSGDHEVYFHKKFQELLERVAAKIQ